jgi:hypothetical protein
VDTVGQGNVMVFHADRTLQTVTTDTTNVAIREFFASAESNQSPFEQAAAFIAELKNLSYLSEEEIFQVERGIQHILSEMLGLDES